MPNFKDYDALTEQKDAFVRVVGGREIECPKVLSARTTLDLRRRAIGISEDDEAANIDFMLEMGEKAMGAESFEHCMEHLGLEEVLEVCTDLLAYYGIAGQAEDEAAPKAEAEPESASTTSSPTGEPSTLTSSAFGLIPGGLSTPESSPGCASSVG